MNDLTIFKNDILFRAIHKEERYPSMEKNLDKARRIYQYNKRELFNDDSSLEIYCSIGYKVFYTKGLIKVCDDLQAQGYELQGLVKLEEDYYQEIFKSRITEANAALRKLRPYVLKYCEGFGDKAREQLKDDNKIGRLFGKWFEDARN